MSDHELLVLAAKVYGIETPEKYWMYPSFGNPLMVDSDAFRVSVSSCFTIVQWLSSVEIKIGDEHIHTEVSDGSLTRLELTRRAIVQALVKLKGSK